MGRFRKKPVVIEAVQFVGTNDEEIAAFVGEHGRDPDEDRPSWIIETLEGDMRADVNDWIIRGVKGELYPCKPDIFEATYDQADKQPSEASAEITVLRFVGQHSIDQAKPREERKWKTDEEAAWAFRQWLGEAGYELVPRAKPGAIRGYTVEEHRTRTEALRQSDPGRFGRMDPKGDPAPAGEDYLQVESFEPFTVHDIVQNCRTGECVRVLEVQDEPEAPALSVQRGVGSVSVEMLPGDELLVIASAAPEDEAR